jgi:hypothetical protein
VAATRLLVLSGTILSGTAMLLALPACQAAAPGGAAVPPGAPGAPPTTTAPAPPGNGDSVVVDEHNNHRTVTLATGQRLELDLHNLYWNVQGSQASELLSQDGPTQTRTPAPGGCPPGVGCGLLRSTFTARQAGATTVTASRTTCGEALRCTGDQGTYRLTVIITR